MKPTVLLLLLAGCAATPRPDAPRPVSAREPGVYTPASQVALPNGALSTSCTFDGNGLGAACRPLDRDPQGPIPPISAGQPR